MTLVDFTTAVAALPTSRPSSSAASRLISETTRNSPQTISTWAITRSRVMPTTMPGKRLRALEVRSAPLAEAFPLARASARNRFVGLVTRVQRDGVMAQVDLQAGPFRIVSLMSREAADELGLQPGMLAAASAKATNVTIELPPGADR